MTPRDLAELYSQMVRLYLKRPHYDVLGRRGEGSVNWPIFEKLAAELEEREADPEKFLAAQFELTKKVPYPFPRMLLHPSAWNRYGEYLSEEAPEDVEQVNTRVPERKFRASFAGSLYTLKMLQKKLVQLSRLDLYLLFPHLFSPLFVVSDPVYGKAAGERLSSRRLGIRQAGKLLASPSIANLFEELWRQHAPKTRIQSVCRPFLGPGPSKPRDGSSHSRAARLHSRPARSG